MDVLSEVLKVVKLHGAMFYNGEFSSPWSFCSPASHTVAPYVSPAARHVIIYHLLTEGRASARLVDGERIILDAGDIVIFPHGDPHFIENGAPTKPVEMVKELARIFSQGLKLSRMGGGGEVTKFVCGFMACEPRLSQVFLSGLPPVFKVSIRNDASGRWLENSIRFSVNEADTSRAGGEAVLAKLSEVLFVETLRAYIAHLPPEQTGWLAGARDSEVGKTLALMHRNDCFSGKRSGSVTLGAGGALPPLPQRDSDGLPHALATSVGSANAGLNQLFGGADRRRSRVRI
jgi:Cupin